MLIRIDPRRQQVMPIAGQAHIILSLDANGAVLLQSSFQGAHDATYGHMDDARLLGCELPKLLVELRNQIQGLSGSVVTE